MSMGDASLSACALSSEALGLQKRTSSDSPVSPPCGQVCAQACEAAIVTIRHRSALTPVPIDQRGLMILTSRIPFLLLFSPVLPGYFLCLTMVMSVGVGDGCAATKPAGRV